MRRSSLFVLSLLAIALISVVFAAVLRWRQSQYLVRLPGGVTFTLKDATLISTNFTYSHQDRSPLWDLIAPAIPDSLQRKIPWSTGSFGFGVEDGSTNLVLITVLRAPPASPVSGMQRLRVSDGTNVFDACWGAHTLGMMNQTVNGWQVRAFPRRGPELILEFLRLRSDGERREWELSGRFKTPNPAFGVFPQWTAGSRAQTNGDLVVQLESFRSGGVAQKGANGALDPRETELHFGFQQAGRPSTDWRVQKVTISDATGNRWFPYLDLVQSGLNFATGGEVHFLGALWPGEAAWKLEVEAVQIGGIAPVDLFSFELPIPPRRSITTLTNDWAHDGATVQFVGLASPNTDHPGEFIWTGKWWGEDKDHVYSLVLKVNPGLNGQRLQLASASDEDGKEVRLVAHHGQDYSQQALFFSIPSPTTQKLKLTFSMTRSRLVEFLARPEFVGNTSTPGQY